MKKGIIKKTALRFVSAILSAIMLSGYFAEGTAFAEGETTEPVAVQAAETEAVQTTLPDITPGNVTTAEVTTTTPLPEGSIVIEVDGEQVVVQQGTKWLDEGVEGTDEPTLPAKSVDEFVGEIPSVDAEENLYTLTVATGMNAGSSVEYLAVRYIDSNDVSQTKYLFPKSSSLKMTNDYISGLSYKGMRVFINGYVRSDLGGVVVFEGEKYQAGDLFRRDFSEYEWENIYMDCYDLLEWPYDVTTMDEYYPFFNGPSSSSKHKYINDLGYKVNETTSTETALDSWSVDEYLFKCETGLKEVTSIEAFMSSGKWTVQGMTVSKVNKINGYGEYGYVSGKYFLSLEKDRLCQLVSYKSGAQTFSASGDKLINIGGDGSPYYTLEAVSQSNNTAPASPMKDIYTFRFDIADNLDAGLESLLRSDPDVSDPAAGTIAEDIAVQVEYKDRNGWTRNATFPVLLSMLAQYKESGDTVRTIGLAQRGDTLAFSGCLPEYSQLLSYKIYVGSEARNQLKATGGIEPTSADNVTLTGTLDSDAISFSSLSIYKGTCRMSNYPDGKDTITSAILPCYSYGFSFSEKDPEYYYTLTTKTGFIVNPGTSATVDMRPYTPGAPLIAVTSDNNFIVRLKTDSANELASTKSDIFVKVNYQSYDGSQQSTSRYNAKTEMLDFMGYWPSSAGVKDNFAYSYGTSLGKIVEFPVKLNDAASVTGLEISLGESSDDWQMSGISIEILDGIGKRRIYKQEIKSQSSTSQYRIVRTLDKAQLPSFPINLTSPQLFLPGDSYDYSTGKGTFTPSAEIDYNSVRYSMTYEQTKLNYGYSKVRKVYDINVKVADDDSQNNINGDSGSSNLFYFQLLFKNGNSAFVLANQQLASDAFRAGCNEMFRISVNRDYGDVTAVRILPESVTEDSELFDKLNIEEITVTERNNGGSGMQYVINSVGWIDIDYHDSGDDKSLSGRQGRSVGQLASTYKITSQCTAVNLLCEISAMAWNTTYFPMSASISCDLEYIDIYDQPRTVSFDVVDRMYDYMKKSPKLYSAELDGSNQSLYNNMGSVSDPNFMLRPAHTDRFILPPLADAKTLKSMTFRATNRGKGTGYWVIGALTISCIESDTGNITITENGDYVRGMLTKEYCSMEKTTRVPSLTIPAGQPQPLKIKLGNNKIDWIDSSSWISAVKRTPDSINDQLNIYVYPTADSRNINGVNVSAAMQYIMPNSKVMQVSQSSLLTYGSGTEDAVFYYTGLNAQNMHTLSDIKLVCRDMDIAFDHALVQQVRENVVVATYYVPFGGSSALLGLTGKMSDNVEIAKPRYQKMLLSFGDETVDAPLFNKESNVNDIAIALQYRSVLDHGINKYDSPYVYLTDVGINKITSGMMAEIPFDLPFATEITGYKIAYFGEITADIDAAMVSNYTYSTKNVDETTGEVNVLGETLEDIFTFPKSFEIKNSIETVECKQKGLEGEDTVNLVDIIFTTASAESSSNAGTDSPVEVTFYYKDSKNNDKAWVFRDITKYIQSDTKQFIPGEDARVRLFLPDCTSLIGMRIRPYNDEGNATWKIEKISGGLLSIGEKTKRVDRIVDTEFKQINGGDSISVKTVSMATYVTVNNRSEYVRDGLYSLSLDGGTAAVIQVNADDGGFTAKAELVENGVLVDVSDQVLYNKVDNQVVFYLKKNNGTTPLTYQITITSDQNDSVKDVINILIPVAEPEETTTTTQTAASNETTTTTTAAETSPVETTAASESEQQNTEPTEPPKDENNDPETQEDENASE